ncbi:L-2-hydroxyglutarate oxidase [Aureivirga sp. CE67]|uniref:L-2-hydroxyglutarate oxidase n=1 Tax=Aureivirga sp. CE67 TaxID=1788983 RepID=UPI0018CAE6DE|nr:L-2-hydroxyglutarate oxidase [Aureivirga sp. CE67]
MSNHTYDFAIIGGGIVGVATAYKLQQKYPNKSIVIFEKEKTIGAHQTGRNSGVIHSGIYYKPGSYKALNCKNGRDQLVDFVEKYNVKHEICGKVIVATKESEIPILDNIYKRGVENGTPGIRFVNNEEIKEKEPLIDAIKGIWVPTAGIVDYVGMCEKMVALLQNMQSKSKIYLETKVENVLEKENTSLIQTSNGDFEASKVIFCTGLFSDRNAVKDDLKINMQIVGFRGDYYELVPEARYKIKGLVYPVPDPQFPFLGVHFTKMTTGAIECGPNAVFTFKREGYKRTSFNLKDSWQALTYKGTWKIFLTHWRKGLDEYKRAFSKKLFVKELQKMMPTLTMDDVRYCRAGVRAQALDSEGGLVDDFLIETKKNHVHVLNAPSPAATSCLAIADQIVEKI